MHLLHTTEHKIKDFENNTPFAILSHTWGKDEVTFDDVSRSNMKTKEGYEKVKRFCSVAAADGFNYVWMDTCCIDKGSSAELSEAINSMYRWYQDADVCYAYLEDVPDREFSQSRWFTRGWTLQELIAPSTVIFFDKSWEMIGTKSDLAKLISARTRIPVSILLGGNLQSASIAQRMSWASRRETTRVEDVAYCLMGIFNVNMPMIYGEGERAFIRLQEEIMKSSDDFSLFAWKSMENHGGLLATSPAAFGDSYDIVRLGRFTTFSSPISVDNQGIHLKLRFIPQNGSQLSGLAILNCTQGGNLQNPLAIDLEAKDLTKKYFRRVRSERLHTIDLSNSSWPEIDVCVQQPHSTRAKNSEDRKRFKVRESTSPLVYATKHGLESMARDLLEDDHESGITPLLRAAEIGDEALFKLLLGDNNDEVNSGAANGQTPLYIAAENGHEAIVRLLLRRADIKVNSKATDGQTPLYIASANGHEAIVSLLLGRTDTQVNAKAADGETSLYIASAKGHEAIVELLLARSYIDVNSKAEMGQTPLYIASENGHEAVVRLLLKRMDIAVNSKATGGQTPLYVASAKGHEAVVKLLLDHIDIEAGSNEMDEQEPLWSAALTGDESVVRLDRRLLDEKCKDLDGMMPLSIEEVSEYEVAITMLPEEYAALVAYHGTGQKPLLWAARSGHVGVVKALLEYGAELECKGASGRTALSWAASLGHEEVVHLLLAQPGIDMKCQDDTGRGPLSWAAMHGCEEVVKQLSSEISDGETDWQDRHLPLFQAAKEGHREVIRLLDMESNDADRWMPLWLALMYWHEETVKLLLEDQIVDDDQWTALWLAVEYQWARVGGEPLKQPR